jgi:hypothetical protein
MIKCPLLSVVSRAGGQRFETFRFRMEYQHMLMDFLPPAWTVVKKLKKGTAHL